MANRSPTGPPPTTRTVLAAHFVAFVLFPSCFVSAPSLHSTALRLDVGVWIWQAEVDGISISVGSSCQRQYIFEGCGPEPVSHLTPTYTPYRSFHCLVQYPYMTPIYECSSVLIWPPRPRRSSSSKRLQIRGHFQWPPVPDHEASCLSLTSCLFCS